VFSDSSRLAWPLNGWITNHFTIYTTKETKTTQGKRTIRRFFFLVMWLERTSQRNGSFPFSFSVKHRFSSRWRFFVDVTHRFIFPNMIWYLNRKRLDQRPRLILLLGPVRFSRNCALQDFHLKPQANLYSNWIARTSPGLVPEQPKGGSESKKDYVGLASIADAIEHRSNH